VEEAVAERELVEVMAGVTVEATVEATAGVTVEVTAVVTAMVTVQPASLGYGNRTIVRPDTWTGEPTKWGDAGVRESRNCPDDSRPRFSVSNSSAA